MANAGFDGFRSAKNIAVRPLQTGEYRRNRDGIQRAGIFFRTKRSGGFEYLQMVQSHRVNGKPRQTVMATLGRLDALKQTGELDRLLRSGTRLTETGMLLSAVE